MDSNNSNADTNKYLFINMVTMLSITAMQQLGKLISPAVGKTKVNLEAAQATIDTLDMLSARTKGNLDNDEERLLKDTLSTLKMNYVETAAEMKNESAVAHPGSAEGFAEARGTMADATKAPPEASPRRERGMQNEKPPKEPKDAAPESEPPAQEKSEPKPGSEQTKDPKFHKSYD